MPYLPLRGRQVGVLIEEEALRIEEGLDEEGLHKKRFHFNCRCNTIEMGPETHVENHTVFSHSYSSSPISFPLPSPPLLRSSLSLVALKQQLTAAVEEKLTK